MSVAARTAERAEGSSVSGARVRLGTAPALALLVGGSFVLRLVVGWLRATPTFFADEYIYAELARSLAESGRPLVRGASAGFPALLQPLLTAPAWLVEDVGTSFRLVQAGGALFMSLAAVPVFLLARRVGLGRGLALALAALALAVPDLVYTGWVIAEPVAYPLALAAVAAGVTALARPCPRLQLAFLGLAGLAAFARVQFVVLPACFLVAAFLLGLRERRLRAVAREQLLVLALVLLPVAAVFALGPGRALGFYEGVLDLDVASGAMAKWLGADAMLLVYASGIVLVPGALLGLWLAFRSPRSREELAFAALAVPVVVALLAEAAAYGIGGERIQERYFFYAVPLVGIAFALYATRGWPHRLAHGALAAGLVALAARVPLSGYSAADGKTNAPTLFAAARLEEAVGDVGLASLAIALGVALLAAVLVAASRRPARATPVVLGLALALSAAAYAGAASFGIANAKRTQAGVLGGSDPSFVDASGVEGAAMVQTRSSERGVASEYLFWNRSVDDVYLLPGAEPPDSFAVTRLEIARDGTLLAAGEPVTRPLLVDGLSDTVRFRGAEETARSPVYRLLRSQGPQRLGLYAPGRSEDGWLGLNGSVRLWPESAAGGLAGTLSFHLSSPVDDAAVVLAFVLPGGRAEEVTLPAGAEREVSFAVCSAGPWQVDFTAPATGSVGTRTVSVRASEPAYRPDPAACPSS
ncbi:MAG TPA: hypothetical protein VD704_09340 [Gaiellaceae bacterium]|nr:hypothetical protein [Gaiellaceae bacterium]